MSQKVNSPFLLTPSPKDYLWGGTKINNEFAKGLDVNPLAETWECSTHPSGLSYVASGKYQGLSLAEVLKEHNEYLGRRIQTQGELPILIKFIDARDKLSVQVHPTDQYAKEHEDGQLGKTEMWYVLDAEEGANLVYGLTHTVSEQTLLDAIENGDIEKYLQKVQVKKNDVFFIQAGTIHAIGAGILVAEIQENSNLTYRLYDYNRVDKDGKKRELHVKKALEVADLSSKTEPKQPLRVLKYKPGVASELLCRCKYFEVYRMLVNTERKQEVFYQTDEMCFRVLLCLNGCGTINFYEGTTQVALNVYKGDCVFVPADSVKMKLHGQMTFLDIRG